MGTETMYSNMLGLENTAVGDKAMYHNDFGNQNTAVGFEALHSAKGQSYGYTALGYKALHEQMKDGAGSWGNTAVGFGAGMSDQRNGTCTYLGTNSDYVLPQPSFVDNATAIGYLSRITGGNQVRVGNSSVASIGGYASWTDLSDGRFKNKTKEDVRGLEFILKLRPLTYNLDMNALAEYLKEDYYVDGTGGMTKRAPDADVLIAREAKGKIRYSGFIAQEVEKAALETGYDFSGVDKPQNDHALYGLRYAEFTVPLVKAVQEQQTQIEQLKAENAQLRQQVTQLQALEARIQALENQNR